MEFGTLNRRSPDGGARASSLTIRREVMAGNHHHCLTTIDAEKSTLRGCWRESG